MKCSTAFILTCVWLAVFFYACVVLYVAERRHEQQTFTTTEVVWNGD